MAEVLCKKAKLSAQPVAFLCEHCGFAGESRNKIFKHLTICGSKNLKEALSAAGGSLLRNVEDVCSVDSADVYLYVLGGRHRGKTLGSSERFSFKKQVWEASSPMLENRGSHGCAAHDKYVYALGGGGFKSNLASCERCDIKTGIWSNIAPMSTLRHALTVVSSVSRIYCIGGWIDGSICSADLEAYDIVSDKWFALARMNLPRRLAGATVWNGSIFVFGGNCSDGNHLDTSVVTNGWYTASAERYSILNNEWSNIRDVPCKGPTSAATIGPNIYVFVHGKCVYRLTPTNDTYEYVKLCDLPEHQWFSFDVTSFGQRIYLIGGSIDGAWSTKCYSFDTITCSFTQLPSMHTPRRRTACVIIESA